MTSTTEAGTDRAMVARWLGGTYGGIPRFDPDWVLNNAIIYVPEQRFDAVLVDKLSERSYGHVSARFLHMAREVTADDMAMASAADVRRAAGGGLFGDPTAARQAAHACPPQMRQVVTLLAARFVGGYYSSDYPGRAARGIERRATEGREYVAATSRNVRGRALNATLDPDRDNEDVANDLGDLARAHGHGNGGSRAHSRGKRGTKRKAAVAMAGLFDF